MASANTSHYSLQWHDTLFGTCAASLYIQDNGADLVNSCSALCFPLNLQSAASCFIQYNQFFKALKRELLISSYSLLLHQLQ